LLTFVQEDQLSEKPGNFGEGREFNS